MKNIRIFFKRFFLAVFCLSLFNLMAAGIGICIPVTIITILFLTIFSGSGFLTLIIYYMFIL